MWLNQKQTLMYYNYSRLMFFVAFLAQQKPRTQITQCYYKIVYTCKSLFISTRNINIDKNLTIW